MDKIKLGFALLLLIAGIAGFYYLRDSAMVIRVISVLAGIVLAAVMVWFTPKVNSFMHSVRSQRRKPGRVVWPSRKETMQTTGIVFAFVLVMAIFLWMVDAGLLLAVKYLMGQEG